MDHAVTVHARRLERHAVEREAEAEAAAWLEHTAAVQHARRLMRSHVAAQPPARALEEISISLEAPIAAQQPTWSCSRCSYVNRMSVPSCEACEVPVPASPCVDIDHAVCRPRSPASLGYVGSDVGSSPTVAAGPVDSAQTPSPIRRPPPPLPSPRHSFSDSSSSPPAKAHQMRWNHLSWAMQSAHETQPLMPTKSPRSSLPPRPGSARATRERQQQTPSEATVQPSISPISTAEAPTSTADSHSASIGSLEGCQQRLGGMRGIRGLKRGSVSGWRQQAATAAAASMAGASERSSILGPFAQPAAWKRAADAGVSGADLIRRALLHRLEQRGEATRVRI